MCDRSEKSGFLQKGTPPETSNIYSVVHMNIPLLTLTPKLDIKNVLISGKQSRKIQTCHSSLILTFLDQRVGYPGSLSPMLSS